MNLFFRSLYEILIWIFAILSLPRVLYGIIKGHKYRRSLWAKFGGSRNRYQNKTPYRSIWIHAVSVGETKSIISLARNLKKQYPNHPLIISNTTETGHQEALRSIPQADAHLYFPFDSCWITSKMIKEANPGIIILAESDFWYRFLWDAKKHGAKIVLVNGKMSARSARRFYWFNKFSYHLFKLFDLGCVQNPIYLERFLRLGVSSERWHVTGNLKFDLPYPHVNKSELANHIYDNQFVILTVSSHSPEENSILLIFKKLLERKPLLQLILAPRHPHRTVEIERLLQKYNFSWIRWSQLSQTSGKPQVILMDLMGHLNPCYAVASVVMVGGSWFPGVGGHNILEPTPFGVPVLFGPYMENQQELEKIAREYEIGMQIPIEELHDTLKKLLEDSSFRLKFADNSKGLGQVIGGGLIRTLELLNPLLT